MDGEPRGFSRRQFLARNAWVVGFALAACAPAPSQPAGSGAAQPTSPPAGGAPAPAAATSAPAAAATPAAQAAAATPAAQAAAPASSVFNFWFSANCYEITDKTVGDTFVEWGRQKGLKVEWQSIPGSPQQLAKESAALAAGQPPELNNANRTYWFSQ